MTAVPEPRPAGPQPATACKSEATSLAWEALPDGCWRLTSPGFSMNSGLVVGSRLAALIDTGAGPREAEAIHRAVRRITDAELLVINTHAHGDHFLGNEYFRAHGAKQFYAGNLAMAHMEESAAHQRALVRDLEPEMAAGVGQHTELHLPTRGIGSAPHHLNLGDRFITLQQVGSAHSPGDLTVRAGRVLFAGDVVEQGGPPNFEDSHPRRWLRLLEDLATGEAADTVFVPGHGGTVDRDFVARQAEQLHGAISLCRLIAARHAAGSGPSDDELTALPYGPVESRYLYERLTSTYP